MVLNFILDWVEQIECNGGLLLFISLWGPNSQELPWKFPYAHQPMNFFENLQTYK